MAMSEKRSEIIAGVESIGQFGKTTALDRTLSVLTAVFNGTSPQIMRESAQRTFETRISDHSQCVIFGNPTLELATKLIDLYDGRLQSLEMIGVDDSTLARAEAIASGHLETTRPTISIDLWRYRNTSEIIAALEELIKTLSTDRQELDEKLSQGPNPDHHFSPLFRFDRCKPYKYTSGPWVHIDEAGNLSSATETCTSTFCEGATEDKQVRVVGRTGGAPDCKKTNVIDLSDPQKPPTGAPPKSPVAGWNNQLPVFEDPKAGIAITSPYGWRIKPFSQDVWEFHRAMDIGAPAGTMTSFPIDGEILAIRTHPNPGKAGSEIGLWVKHGDVICMYWHVHPASGISVGPFKGPLNLGTVYDWPGEPKRAHLHLECHLPPGGKLENIDKENTAVNPLPNFPKMP